MKKLFTTSKFYPCYPIFIVAYYNDNNEPQISTLSSSYSLGDNFILGVLRTSSFGQYLINNSDFSVNFLDRRYIDNIETIGLLSHKTSRDKTAASGFSFTSSTIINAPYIDEASLIFECKAETAIFNNDKRYINSIASIENRICDEHLLIDDVFQYDLLDIPLFEGDAKGRVYRFMTDEAISMGNYKKDNK